MNTVERKETSVTRFKFDVSVENCPKWDNEQLVIAVKELIEQGPSWSASKDRLIGDIKYLEARLEAYANRITELETGVKPPTSESSWEDDIKKFVTTLRRECRKAYAEDSILTTRTMCLCANILHVEPYIAAEIDWAIGDVFRVAREDGRILERKRIALGIVEIVRSKCQDFLKMYNYGN